MELTLYLPTETWHIIDSIGPYRTIIKNIVDYYTYSTGDKPLILPAPPKRSTKYSHRVVDIDNEDFFLDTRYITILKNLVCSFIDQEFYTIVDISKTYNTQNSDKIDKFLYNLHKNLESISNLVVTEQQKEYYIGVTRELDKLTKSFNSRN